MFCLLFGQLSLIRPSAQWKRVSLNKTSSTYTNIHMKNSLENTTLFYKSAFTQSFESEQSTTCFQQHETSVSELNLCWFMLRITDLSHGQHLSTDWPQFSHMICVSAGPTTAEQDGHTPTPQQSCKLTLFSTTKKRRKKERYWNIGVKTPSHFTVCKNRVQP